MDMNERLRRWREGQGWSLEEAAVHIGCSASALRNYENGSVPKNRALRTRIKRVLAAHKRRIDALLGEGE